MPKFNVTADVVVVDPLNKVKTITPIALTADTATPVLAVDLTRKGHAVKNTGSTRTIEVSYGLTAPEDVGFTEIYMVSLKPGEVYLYDVPEIIPYSCKSIGGTSTLTVMEFE